MAKQVIDYVSPQRLEYFKDKYDEKVVKDLEPYAKTTDLEGTYAKTTDLEGYLQEGDLTGYVQEGALADYAKTADVAKSYATTEKVTSLEQTLTELSQKSANVWHLSADPVKTKADLVELADTATVGEAFIISDDNNHVYIFLGKEVAGADENGFYDTQTHISLDGYAKTEDLDTFTEITTEAIDAMFTEV